MWNEAKVQQLKTLVASGLSSSQIAAELGGVTRNAVIGKVSRLGLQRPLADRPAGPRPRARRVSTRRIVLRAPAPAVAVENAPARLHERPAGGLTIHELGARDCRWPIGDPLTPDFCYCGGPVPEGAPHPYCNEHLWVSRYGAQDGAGNGEKE